MASLIFQRSAWRLQILRSQRTFSVSFSTNLPQRSRPSSLLPETHTSTSSHSSRRRHHERVPRRPHHEPSSTYQQARRAFTSSCTQHAQESSSSTPATDAPQSDLTLGLSDQPVVLDEGERQVDWTRSFHGLSTEPFPKEAGAILTEPIATQDIEVKPDGIIYLPEIKYRRILNRAFGPGGWGLAPRGETIVTSKAVTREYALVVLGRLVSVARGEQDYFSPEGIPTAAEGCKSNALMRCCKDLGIASELWDPRFIREFMKSHAKEVFVEHAVTKRKKKIFLRKDDQPRYPFKETKAFSSY